MKLFEKWDMVRYMRFPDAWLLHGRHVDHQADYLMICLPLFVLMWRPCYDWSHTRFGWYVPRVLLVYGHDILMVRWKFEFHSDFMGEEQVVKLK